MRLKITLLFALISLINYSQNIKFSFANSTNYNDGSLDYFEVDVLIQTIDGQADFKLGSGQLYFNYNTEAFGDNLVANSNFQVTADLDSGYFLGEESGFTNFFDISTINDNSISRVSWAFSQGVSSGAMTEVVNATPRKLIHLKIKYLDVNKDPILSFESNEGVVTNSRDQFFTACGPFDTSSTTLDCSDSVNPENLRVQFFDATFESSGAVLNFNDFEMQKAISIYPNPAHKTIFFKGDITSLKEVVLYNAFGSKVLNVNNNFDEINIESLASGLYFVKLKINDSYFTQKLIKK